MAGVSELPLLHKYVIRPQDDLQLVMTKLNFRLCVKQVSEVNNIRSRGSSVSEAVNICELASITPPRSTAMSNTDLMTRQVAPLVFSEDPDYVSSPKLLSPSDSSYCGTMKSDDSGIVMDDSHNFSMTSSGSDHERDVELNFTSSEVSPVEEENEFVHCTVRGVSVSPDSVDESPVKVVDLVKKTESNGTVEEFFRNSVNLEDEEEREEEKQEQVEEENEQTEERIETEETPEIAESYSSPNSEESSTLPQEGTTASEEITYVNDTASQQAEDQSEATEESHDPEVDLAAATDEAGTKEEEPEVEEEIIEQQKVEEVSEEVRLEVPQQEKLEEQEEEHEEQEEQKQEEEERVDFVKEEEPEETLFDPGIKCNDAYTALDILKTKYRLSDASVFRKFIITFSSWDVSQISHPISSDNRCSWWEDDVKEDYPEDDDPQVDELMEQIYSRQGEISELVDSIMEREAEKIRAQQAAVEVASEPAGNNAQPGPENSAQQTPDEIVPCEQVITPAKEAVPESQSAPINSQVKPADKKRNRNALRRFIHAMRKRLRRNRPPSEASQKDT